jgi:hypothetical protein
MLGLDVGSELLLELQERHLSHYLHGRLIKVFYEEQVESLKVSAFETSMFVKVLDAFLDLKKAFFLLLC